MYTKINKNIKKVLAEINKLSKYTKRVLNFGLILFLILFAAGTAFYAINKSYLGFDLYYDFIATTIIKNSFNLLAIVIIGCLLLDYAFNRE